MEIIFNEVSFSYGSEDVLEGIDIVFTQNDVVGLLGENGSGKTTLGKLCMGILNCQAGSIFVDGENIVNIPLWKIGKHIGYLFQNPRLQLFSSVVQEEMLFPYTLMGSVDVDVKNRCQELLNTFNLSHLHNENCHTLSIGEKQRLALATLLMNKPKYLILDEPTTGLDNQNKQVLLQQLKVLKGRGIGMLIISHDEVFLHEIQNRMLIIDKKKLKEIC